jgi:hypothetical protein
VLLAIVHKTSTVSAQDRRRQEGGRFVLYLDRRLQDTKTVERLKAAFGLASTEVVVQSDLHYR